MYTRNEKIVPVYIEEEMKDSYINYAMSVIVGRALPDARDGLKPVHRRILYAMMDLGLEHNKPYKKTARIVGECFTKDTLVTSDKGLIPIQEIRRGDLVYTQNGLEKVTNLFEMPPRELLKIELENGLSNTVTPSQKFKVITKTLGFAWKEAKEIRADDYVVMKAAYPEIKNKVFIGSYAGSRPIYLNENIAYALGALLSDGWIEGGTNRLCFYSTRREVMDRIYHIFREEFSYEAKIETKPYIYKTEKSEIKNTAYQIRIHKRRINEFFVRMFLLKGVNALTKKIPCQIFVSPPSVVWALISGLIDGDGSIHNNRNVIHYGSISEELINQLQILLHHQNVLGVRYSEEPGNRHIVNRRMVVTRHKFYSLEIRGAYARLLASRLSLAEPRKNARIINMLAREGRDAWSSLDAIPYAGKMIFEELTRAHLGGGWYQDAGGAKFRSGVKYKAGCKIRYSSDLSEKPLKISQIVDWGIIEKLKRTDSAIGGFLGEVIRERLYFAKVASVEPAAAEKTFDIQVANKHEFIANGMISHNCLGKYHPHGDVAVYDTLVRMAQDFSLRYPLVDGQGNFGSVDGDPAASMRYTEARLEHITDWMLLDIEKNTVDFTPNFDNSLQEPTVLPACLPNLLVNGSSGIAVGMATNIPPHNLKEVCEAAMYVIDNPECEAKDLLKKIKGPDFPTGGIIRGTEGIKKAYTTGRGIIRVNAKAYIEESKSGKEAIIVKEIPYMVNKSNLIESIARLVQEKKIEGISDLRDESDKDGMRIVVELKRGVNANIILNQLYKRTQMQETFGVIMLALVDGRPRVLDLKEVLEEFVKHRKNIIVRRTRFDLEKAQERAHILEGLKIALKNLDRIIKIIKESENPQAAKEELIKKFDLSDRQAQAILEMQLQRLTGLERDKIDREYLELIKRIELYKSILASEKKVLEIIKDETKLLCEKFGDERRTEIAPEQEELEIEDLIAEEDVVTTISHAGYIKRLPVSSYRKQRRGGKGVTGAEMKEEDFIEHLFIASTHDYILFFTDKGVVHWLKVHEIPEAGRLSKGKAVINLLSLASGEKISAFVPVREFKEGRFLIMATKTGNIKKTTLTAYANPRKGGIIGMGLEKDDELIGVELTNGDDEILLGTREGKAIRFKESQVRETGRAAKGVRGIRLGKKDACIAMQVVRADQTVLTVTGQGFGKRTPFKEYRLQSRGGKGIINIKTTGKNGETVCIKTVSDRDEIMLMTEKGMIVRSPIKDIRATGRSTQGVRLIRVEQQDAVASIAKIVPEDEDERAEEETVVVEAPQKSPEPKIETPEKAKEEKAEKKKAKKGKAKRKK
ncbi:MAG: DNA gyrase subunit A [Candidatus Omnitrophota bacterium]|nr:DNA gyrase subunit A [Candidatus Omnitrophota bacterium]